MQRAAVVLLLTLLVISWQESAFAVPTTRDSVVSTGRSAQSLEEPVFVDARTLDAFSSLRTVRVQCCYVSGRVIMVCKSRSWLFVFVQASQIGRIMLAAAHILCLPKMT